MNGLWIYSLVFTLLHIEVQFLNLLTSRESAIFERVPSLRIKPRYSSQEKRHAEFFRYECRFQTYATRIPTLNSYQVRSKIIRSPKTFFPTTTYSLSFYITSRYPDVYSKTLKTHNFLILGSRMKQGAYLLLYNARTLSVFKQNFRLSN